MRNDTAQRLKRTIILATLLLFVGLMACRSTKENLNKPVDNSNATANSNSASTTQSPFEIVDSKVIEKQSPFDHNRKEHKTKTQDCAFCHVRPAGAAAKDEKPKLPGHSACQECHQRDFTAKASRMCESCHTVPADAKGTLINFPTKLNEFGLKGFSHRQHDNPEKMKGQMDDASLPGGKPSCSFCHNFESSNVAAKFPAHPECYSCHAHQPKAQQNEGKQSDCGICHAKRDQSLVATRGPGQALSLYNFRHSPAHLKTGTCDRCHKPAEVPEKEVRADIQAINIARGQRHHSTCWTCHTQAREAVCTKCHVGSLPF